MARYARRYAKSSKVKFPKSIKKPSTYKALRRKGMSKQMAAAISNAQAKRKAA